MIKFFDINLVGSTCTYTLTSASSTASAVKALYDRARNTKLVSVGSDDLTDEDWIIEFETAKTFNRILIDNHNIKSGSIQYWNGSAWTAFSTAITLSANADTTNYYEFNAVSSTKIRIRMSTTMVVDAQKFIGSLYVMNELGTVLTNPATYELEYSESSRNHQTSNGGNLYIYYNNKARWKFEFTDSNATDMALFETLKSNAQSFFVYPCGGDEFDDIGWRLKDIFFVNYTNNFNPNSKNGQMLGIGQKLTMILEEV